MAGRFYRIGQKFFSLSFNPLRRHLKNRHWRFYLQPQEDKRNKLARWVDHYGILLLVMVATYLIVLNIARPGTALILSLPLFVMELGLARKINKTKQTTYLNHKKIWRAASLCREELSGLDSSAELFTAVKGLMLKLEKFKGTRFRKIPYTMDQGVFLYRFTSMGVPVALGVAALTGGGKTIQWQQVMDFLNNIKGLGYKNAIYVTNGNFSDDVRRLAAGQSKSINMRLLDITDLVDLSRLAGYGSFSRDEDMTKGLSPAGAGQMHGSFLRATVSGGRKKSYRYLWAAFIIAAMYFFTGVQGPATLLYYLLGVVNLILFIKLYRERENIIGESLESFSPVQ